MGPFNNVKYFNDVIKKESVERESLISIRNSLGPLELGRGPPLMEETIQLIKSTSNPCPPIE